MSTTGTSSGGAKSESGGWATCLLPPDPGPDPVPILLPFPGDYSWSARAARAKRRALRRGAPPPCTCMTPPPSPESTKYRVRRRATATRLRLRRARPPTLYHSPPPPTPACSACPDACRYSAVFPPCDALPPCTPRIVTCPLATKIQTAKKDAINTAPPSTPPHLPTMDTLHQPALSPLARVSSCSTPARTMF